MLTTLAEIYLRKNIDPLCWQRWLKSQGNMLIYISILVFFITKADSSRILVTSGQGICEHGICQKSEIINLESVDGPCQDWVDFPKRAAGATGALLKGYPLICGGAIWLEGKTD